MGSHNIIPSMCNMAPKATKIELIVNICFGFAENSLPKNAYSETKYLDFENICKIANWCPCCTLTPILVGSAVEMPQQGLAKSTTYLDIFLRNGGS